MNVRPMIPLISGIGVIALLAFPPAAFAAHGKAGLWNVTVSIEGAGMPQVSPEDIARMQAMGIQMPDRNTISTQHCMTAAEVNSDRLSSGSAAQQGCTMTGTKTSGHTLSGDMVCNGNLKGEGHMTLDYDKPEHYTGKMTFSGTAGGQPADITYIYDGKWTSPDCGRIDR